MTKLLDQKLDPINEKLTKLDKIESSLDYALEEIRKIADMESSIVEIKADVARLSAEAETLRMENSSLKEQLLKQELYTRRNNLKIYGLPETPPNRLEDDILHLLQGAGITINPRDISTVHYISPVLRNRPRSIIIRFLSFKDKSAVLMKRDLLKQKGVSLAEDYPQEIQERRAMFHVQKGIAF